MLNRAQRKTRLGYVGLKIHVQRRLRARELHLVVDRMAALKKSRRIVISTIRNDAERVPYFLRYYREMGIEHFIFVDNMSTDNLHHIVSDQPDVTVFQANGSYKGSRYGIDWINEVLSRYCVGKWCLHVDTDEFLVFTHCEQLGITGLIEQLQERGQHSLNCVMVDMYSSRPVTQNICVAGQAPLAVCSLFDTTGYERRFDPAFKMVWIKGGVRGRLLFSDLWSGPALNKTPLVFWRRHYAYVHSAHQLWPPAAHGAPHHDTNAPTGALLHFKFLAQFTAKVAEEVGRRQHTSEYEHYRNANDQDFLIPLADCTETYHSPRDLEAVGLIHAGGLRLQANE